MLALHFSGSAKRSPTEILGCSWERRQGYPSPGNGGTKVNVYNAQNICLRAGQGARDSQLLPRALKVPISTRTPLGPSFSLWPLYKPPTLLSCYSIYSAVVHSKAQNLLSPSSLPTLQYWHFLQAASFLVPRPPSSPLPTSLFNSVDSALVFEFESWARKWQYLSRRQERVGRPTTNALPGIIIHLFIL